MAYQGKKQNNPTLLETIIVGIFKGLWFLITLPFSKKVKVGLNSQKRQELLSKRLELEGNLVSNDLFVLKQTLMDADKLVDYALKQAGYAGETFADRLRNAQKNIEPRLYDSIWRGHKVRNQLAHEHNVQVSPNELKEAVYNLLEYLKRI